MTDPISLTLSTTDFDTLVEATHKTRTGSVTVRVSLKALEALLIDHGRLLRVTPHKEPSE